MKLRNKKGFTLLEIIIVIIIIGVLASLALPRFFSTVEYARSTEALNNIGVIRKSIERCALLDGKYANCTDFSKLDIGDPGTAEGTHFSYKIVAKGTQTKNKDVLITATRNADAGGVTTDTILIHEQVGKGVTRDGTTAFVGIN